MIDGLAESFDYAYFTRRIDGCPEDDLLKEIAGKMLGTGESEEKPPRPHMSQGVKIEKLVSARGGLDVASFVRQGRRVKDDDIEGSLAFLEIGESVGFYDLRTRDCHPIKSEILFGQFQGRPGSIQRSDFLCPSAQSVGRKSAAV